MEATITLMGDGNLTIIAPKRANPANRQLVEEWIKTVVDRLFANIPVDDSDNEPDRK